MSVTLTCYALFVKILSTQVLFLRLSSFVIVCAESFGCFRLLFDLITSEHYSDMNLS